MSVINAPDDLSPLKLRGWLMQQAREIQDMSGDHAYTRIRLFLTKRQRFAFTQKKLDVLLQGIVDKFPVIHGIELVEVDRSLTNEEMQAAAEDANVELAELSNSLDEYLEQQGKPKH
jgi:DNA-binding PucR family transcriptional regulator